jgi:hypothetical protein
LGFSTFGIIVATPVNPNIEVGGPSASKCQICHSHFFSARTWLNLKHVFFAQPRELIKLVGFNYKQILRKGEENWEPSENISCGIKYTCLLAKSDLFSATNPFRDSKILNIGNLASEKDG